MALIDDLVDIVHRYYPRAPAGAVSAGGWWNYNSFWWRDTPQIQRLVKLCHEATARADEWDAWHESIIESLPGWESWGSTELDIATSRAYLAAFQPLDVGRRELKERRFTYEVVHLHVSVLAPAYVLTRAIVRHDEDDNLCETTGLSHEPSLTTADVFRFVQDAVHARYPDHQRLGPSDLATPVPGLETACNIPLEAVTLGDCLFEPGLGPSFDEVSQFEAQYAYPR